MMIKKILIFTCTLCCSLTLKAMHFSDMSQLIKDTRLGKYDHQYFKEGAQQHAPHLSSEEMTMLITEHLPCFSAESYHCMQMLLDAWRQKLNINLVNSKNQQSHYSSPFCIVLVLSSFYGPELLRTTFQYFSDSIDINLRDHHKNTALEKMLGIPWIFRYYSYVPHFITTFEKTVERLGDKISQEQVKNIRKILAPEPDDVTLTRDTKKRLQKLLEKMLDPMNILHPRYDRFANIIIVTQK